MNPRRLVAACCGAVAVSMLDTTIVTVALPDLQKDAGVDLADLQWLVNGYLIVFAALTLAGGALADRLGRRRLLLAGLVVFAAGSLVTGLGHPAGGWDELRIGRVVQGLGAALSEPATLALLRVHLPDPRERARALGSWAAAAGTAIALGPVLGGLLVALGGWRAVFIANVPLAALALAAALAWVPRDEPLETGERPDIQGMVLSAVALTAFSYGLIEEQTRGFGYSRVIVALALGVVATALLVVVERTIAAPALPLRVAASPANFAAAAASFAVFAVFFLVTIALQVVGGVSALATAGAFAPMVVLLVAGGLLAGRYAAHRSPRAALVAGAVIAAAGLAATALSIGTSPHVAEVVAPLLLVGLGVGIVLATAAITVLEAAGPEQAGVAAATVNLARQVGGLFAVAALTAVTVGRLSGTLDRELAKQGFDNSLHAQLLDGILHPAAGARPDTTITATSSLTQRIEAEATRAAEAAFTSGLHLALWVAVGVLVVAAILAAVIRPATPNERPS